METTAHEGRPRMSRARKVFLFLLLGIVVLLAGGIATSLRYLYEDFRADVGSYQHIQLGASMEEVLYGMGPPTEVVSENVYDPKLKGEWQFLYRVAAEDGPNGLPKDATVQDYYEWQWKRFDHRIEIIFDDETKRVSSVSCYTQTRSPSCNYNLGVYAGQTESGLVDTLGPPDRTAYHDAVKEVAYDDLGLGVILEQRSVYHIRKYAAKDVSFAWWLVHRASRIN